MCLLPIPTQSLWSPCGVLGIPETPQGFVGECNVLDDAQVKVVPDSTANLAHPSSKHPKHEPFTLSLIKMLFSILDTNDPLDAAVRSCLVISFFTLAWADELAVPSIDSFDLTAHSRRTDVYKKTDCHNLPVTVFRIPHTKCSKDGKDIYCATQPGPINPVFELKNQLAINDPPPNAHLFTYCHANGHWTSIQSP